MTPYYRLYYTDQTLSCKLPDNSAFAAEYARLMVLCQKETLFAVRYKPNEQPPVVLAHYDYDLKTTLVEDGAE